MPATALPAAPQPGQLLGKQLRAARLRYLAGKLVDYGTAALLTAAVLAVICSVLGWQAAWVPPVALLVTAWLVLRRFPSLARVAERLDTEAGTAELLSSAWLVRSSNDPWTQMLVADAAARAESVVRSHRWARLPNGLRTSMLLAAGAIGLGGLLISPAIQSSAAANKETVAASATEKREVQALATWLAPSPVRTQTADPEEAARSIAMNGDAPVRHPGDDARGNGRATAEEAARMKASASAQVSAEAPGHQAGTGDGSPGNAGGNGSAAGGSVAGEPSGQQSPHAIAGEPRPAAGTHSAAASAPPAYRPLIEAYFAR